MQEEITVVFPKDQFTALCNMFQLLAIAGLKFHGTGSAIPSDESIQHIWTTLRTTALSSR